MNKNQKIILLFMCIIGSVIILIAYKYKTGNKENDFSSADIEVISDIIDSWGDEDKSEKNSEEDNSDEAGLAADDISVRVLLSDDGNYYQSNVRFSCDTDFHVDYGTETLEYEKDTVIDLNQEAEKRDFTKIVVKASAEDGKIKILSLEKSDGNPSYRGTINISVNDGKYILTNELLLEEYLYSVVSSEMPSTYESEALKAQAVCARTYAVKKMQDDIYEEYDADIDDTTACQVYNNISENEESVRAVKDTEGVIMTCEGEIIDAYFFSTSCGTTCRNDDVWSGDKEPYLNDKLEAYNDNNLSDDAVMVMTDGSGLKISDGSLASETVFREFINNEIYIDAIEKDMSLYRWKVSFDKNQISEVIFGGLINSVSDGNVTFTDKSGNEITFDKNMNLTEMEEFIGEIQNIEVSKRGYSGIAQSVVIYGENVHVVISNQLTIRRLFNPGDAIIINQDGDKLLGWTMLPSAYFYIDKSSDGGYVIYGGGFGHGVGMSQNGADALASQGYKYTDILLHYFDGVSFENLIETGYL